MRRGEEEQRRERRTVIGKGKYLVCGGETEQGKRGEKIFGEGKYLVQGEEEERRSRKENMFDAEENKKGEGEVGDYWRKKMNGAIDQLIENQPTN